MIKNLFQAILFFWLLFFSYKYFYPVQADDSLATQRSFPSIDASRETAITKAVSQVSPSVVGINVTQLKRQRANPFFVDPFWGRFFQPHTHTYKVESLGSGFIIDDKGYVVTNAHVVENAHEIIVTLTGGTRYEAKIVGVDLLTDIALLKIECDDCPFSEMGDSDDIIVGQWALAIGNPLGLFDMNNSPTATLGIVSGLNLNFGKDGNDQHVYQDMIQTDASINQGNSGGPLVDANGKVIGMNTFIMTGSTSSGSVGLGFAIPINRVKVIIEELKKFGEVNRDFTTGLHVQSVDPALRQYLKLPSNGGVIITDVVKRSAGARAGAQIGDVILAVDDKKVNSKHEILRVIDEGMYKVGDFIRMTIWRDSDYFELKLELEKRKQ